MPLGEEIAELLRLPEDGVGAPSLDAIESTLTDGYAAALALEAELLRIERRLGEVAREGEDPGSVHEFAQLSERLEVADAELARLRSSLRTLQARARAVRRAS